LQGWAARPRGEARSAPKQSRTTLLLHDLLQRRLAFLHDGGLKRIVIETRRARQRESGVRLIAHGIMSERVHLIVRRRHPKNDAPPDDHRLSAHPAGTRSGVQAK
ncbi:MAG: hypothetical protein ACE5E6_00875, partial [Phycisphaerae bacterium]